jgi:hypothetical protein
MVEPLRHRQTKEAATDMFCLKPPRHISTLHLADNPTALANPASVRGTILIYRNAYPYEFMNM